MGFRRNQITILTDGIANARLGDIKKWIEQELPEKILALSAEGKDFIRPKMEFYQKMAVTAEKLKVFFDFFGFQDESIRIEELIDLVRQAKNGVFIIKFIFF